MTECTIVHQTDLRERKHVFICDMSSSCIFALALLSQKLAGDAIILDVGMTSNYPYIQYRRPNARYGIPVYTMPMITRGSSAIKEFYDFAHHVIGARQKTLIVLADADSVNRAGDLMNILHSLECKWDELHTFELDNFPESQSSINQRAEYGFLDMISGVNAPVVLHSISPKELFGDCIKELENNPLAGKIKNLFELKSRGKKMHPAQLICSPHVITALSFIMPESNQDVELPKRGYTYDFLQVNKILNPRFRILSKSPTAKALFKHFLKQLESNTAWRDAINYEDQNPSTIDSLYPLIVPSRLSYRLSEEYFPFHK
ncbi:unnamed protein product [Albugo candida]|uniref:Uncharacterized protein n=1 Tax=Albugo candida TaxID=65357 RepID=A0A024G3E6_9STRA|nr:unnamed protein product [Albugo candida]|eukprot:CCI40824.1 unnamed protein product [Albugo candida]